MTMPRRLLSVMRHLAAVLLGAVVVTALLAATGRVSVAQDQRHELAARGQASSDAWMSGMPDPAVQASQRTSQRQWVAPTARVVGAYRPVDPRRRRSPKAPGSALPAAQMGLDLYVDLADAPRVAAGQSFEVFRKVPAPTLRRSKLTIKVGVVTIVSIEGTLAVARVVGGPDVSSHPFLKTPGVVVGDYILPHKPIVSPKRGVRVRSRTKQAATAAAASSEPAADDISKDIPPDTVGPKEDRDGFQVWGDEPIEF